MISRVVEDEFLAEEATLLATTLARGPDTALGLIRRLARDAEQLPLTDALAAERVAQRRRARRRISGRRVRLPPEAPADLRWPLTPPPAARSGISHSSPPNSQSSAASHR
jgi:hypothetical protein